MVNLGIGLPVDSETIDPEILPLVLELNRIPGVKTYSSCQGHSNQVNDWGCVDPPWAYVAMTFTDFENLRLFAIVINDLKYKFEKTHRIGNSISLELGGNKLFGGIDVVLRFEIGDDSMRFLALHYFAKKLSRIQSPQD